MLVTTVTFHCSSLLRLCCNDTFLCEVSMDSPLMFGWRKITAVFVTPGFFLVVQFTNRLLCEISSSHDGENEVQNCLLGCTARQYIAEDNSELQVTN
jgi:hypothetical protein